MIPDKQSYRVRDAVTRRSLGSVDEAFVLSLNDSGEDDDGSRRQFVMAGRTWLIIDADPEQSELLVAPVSDKAQAPRWVGELPPVPKAIGRDIGRLRQLIADDLQLFETDQMLFFILRLSILRVSLLNEIPHYLNTHLMMKHLASWLNLSLHISKQLVMFQQTV